MQFAECVIDYALQVNTQSLYALRDGAPLSPREIHGLRVNVKRLRAAWAVLDAVTEPATRRRARARLRTIHSKLALQRDRDVLVATIRKLLVKAGSRKLERALTFVAGEVPNADAPRLIDLDTIGTGFEDESLEWRELATIDAPLRAVIDAGFGDTYRLARRLGKSWMGDHRIPKARELHAWRTLAKRSMYQHEIVRPVLSRPSLTRRWYLERLTVALGRHQDLHMLRALVKTSELGSGPRKRLLAFIEQRQSVLAQRAVKLYPRIYGLKTGKFVRLIERDVAKLAIDNLEFLPRRIG